jgi:hypothetical protein
MTKKLLSWIFAFCKRKKLYKIRYVDDIPDKLLPDLLYIVRNENYDWQAVMRCPCGCNKTLQMNLIREYHPSWKYKIEKKAISLYPSIHRQVGCKSHFFLTKGKIVWC